MARKQNTTTANQNQTAEKANVSSLAVSSIPAINPIENAVSVSVTSDAKTAVSELKIHVPADTEAREVSILIPRISRDENGVAIALFQKNYRLPKTVKGESRSRFAVMVQRAILDAVSDKTGAEVGKINAAILKKGGTATDAQKERLNEFSRLMTLIDTTKERLALREIVPTDIARLVGADASGTVLDIELNSVRKSLSNLDACYTGVLTDYAGKKEGETVTKTADACNYETAVRQALKNCLAPFTAETEETKIFKLSIAVSDIVKWYQLGANQWGAKVACRWNDSNSAVLNKSVVKYLLYKIASGENTAEDANK